MEHEEKANVMHEQHDVTKMLDFLEEIFSLLSPHGGFFFAFSSGHAPLIYIYVYGLTKSVVHNFYEVLSWYFTTNLWK